MAKVQGTEALEQKILELCMRYRTGLTDKVLMNSLPNLSQHELVNLLNKLLAQGKIDLLKHKDGLIYKIKDSTLPSSISVRDQEEALVYQAVKEAGAKGIINREIRDKTGIVIPLVNKILKSLAGKKVIVGFNPPGTSRKTVYVVKGVEPHESLLQNAFYADKTFDSAFVDVLCQVCLKFLSKRYEESRNPDPMIAMNVSYVSTAEVFDHITALKVSKVALTLPQVESVLNTLVYDGKAERYVNDDKTLFRLIFPAIPSSELTALPCGLCPVAHLCDINNGTIRPDTCEYMKQWLQS